MLQYGLVKRIERVYRLRLFYGIHLAIYGFVLALAVIAVDPAHWHDAAAAMMLWLPMLIGHTAAQSLYEFRQHCATYEPVPVQPFNRFTARVDIYDEDGRRVSGDDAYLPG